MRDGHGEAQKPLGKGGAQLVQKRIHGENDSLSPEAEPVFRVIDGVHQHGRAADGGHPGKGKADAQKDQAGGRARVQREGQEAGNGSGNAGGDEDFFLVKPPDQHGRNRHSGDHAQHQAHADIGDVAGISPYIDGKIHLGDLPEVVHHIDDQKRNQQRDQRPVVQDGVDVAGKRDVLRGRLDPFLQNKAAQDHQGRSGNGYHRGGGRIGCGASLSAEGV